MSGAFSQRLQDSILKESNSFDWIEKGRKGGASTFKPASYLEEGEDLAYESQLPSDAFEEGGNSMPSFQASSVWNGYR